VARIAESFGIGTSATHQLARLSDFDRSLRQALPTTASQAWSTHLKATALDSLGFLAQDWARPVGLLTQVAPNLANMAPG
jgi:hypothetical protein